jgi:hypothetical protein
MNHDHLNKSRRKEDAYRRLGTRHPQCQHCTETNALALSGIHPDCQCYEHVRLTSGRSPVEYHHLAGRHNDPFTLPIPGNDHRVLSDLQQEWPVGTLRNPDASPLLKIAASIRGWLDILRLIIERTIGWIPTSLEQLDTILRLKLGETWWKSIGWRE